MAERRSGVDLVREEEGWVVVTGDQVVSRHTDRMEAVAAARRAAAQLRESTPDGGLSGSRRLHDDRRRLKHWAMDSERATIGPKKS
jgi:hypothetical protein